jgi:hypothetical protein
MMARLFEMPGGNPMWLANRDTIPQLGTMTIGNNAAYLPINQALSGSPFKNILAGDPLLFNEHCQTLGTKGDIVLADLSGYALATKQGGGIDFAASIHLFFDQNLTAFRWILRAGGQPYLSAPSPRPRAATPSRTSSRSPPANALGARSSAARRLSTRLSRQPPDQRKTDVWTRIEAVPARRRRRRYQPRVASRRHRHLRLDGCDHLPQLHGDAANRRARRFRDRRRQAAAGDRQQPAPAPRTSPARRSPSW